jgi:FkbM family methyltransferase
MAKSNTLNVLGRVLANPKRFAGEWRRSQQDLTRTQQDLARTEQYLARTKQDLSNTEQDLVRTKQDLVKLACRPPQAGELQIYRGYSDSDVDLLKSYHSNRLKPEKGFAVDFVGSRTSIAYHPSLASLDAHVGGVPIPSDWHAEAIEWVGLLKSVEQANNSFAVMELGAGWGPWVVAGAIAARQRGISHVRLCAVEADPNHFAWMLEHFHNNGLDPAQHDLLAAAVGVTKGTAQWPKVSDPVADWGSRPRLATEEGNTDHVGRSFDEWHEVRLVSFGELLKKDVWDLVHMDVQGWEVELCAAEAALLDARVKWLVVGTHEYKLHADLIDLMFRRGWVLENEKPPRVRWVPGAPSLLSMTTHDGTQVWRNPASGTLSAR